MCVWHVESLLCFDYFCRSLFTIHGAHSWKKKCNLFMIKMVRLAMVVFWISAFSSVVSCKISLLLPHQCPNFILKLLNFTSTTNYPNLYEAFDTHTLWNSLYSDKVIQTLWNSLYHCDFLGCERKSTTKLMSPLWGRDADVRFLWVVFKFLEFFDVSMCFPFLLGMAEFCINKISIELCRFVCGFCIFVGLIRGFLCISFNFVGVFLSLKWL